MTTVNSSSIQSVTKNKTTTTASVVCRNKEINQGTKASKTSDLHRINKESKHQTIKDKYSKIKELKYQR